MKRRKWLLGLVAVVVVALAVLATALLGGGADYFSVGELLAQATSLAGETVSVRGVVVPGSITWDENAEITSFALADGASRVVAVYQGTPPDGFAPGADLLVVGTYELDGVIRARHIREPSAVCAACH